MPRKPREDVPGAVHHVYARGNRSQAIFLDVGDRREYLATLGHVVFRKRWSCLAYCLMPNHVHLLLETPEANLAAGMQYLHGSYAQAFNKRHACSGHLFQGRYGSVRVKDDLQVWTTIRYIAHNPVNAGLSTSPATWPWSSYAAALGGPAPAWLDVAQLLSYFTAMGGPPRERYVELTG